MAVARSGHFLFFGSSHLTGQNYDESTVLIKLQSMWLIASDLHSQVTETKLLKL